MNNYSTIPTISSGVRDTEFISSTKDQLKARLTICRPWKEMVQSFNLPSGFSSTIKKIETNLDYFLINYVIVVLLILFFSLLNHPISLMVFVALLLVVWMFLYFFRDKPLVVFHRLIDNSTVMIIWSIITVILLLFTGPILNIVSALLTGAVCVEIHAAVRKIDDLFLDEEAAEAAGLMTTSSS